MENIGQSHAGTRLDLAQPERFEAFALARVNTENLAERIAAVLDERRRIGVERRLREREYLLRKSERAQVGERRRGEPKDPGRHLMKLDALLEAVISSNAAIEALKDSVTLDVIEDASGTERRELYGHACI